VVWRPSIEDGGLSVLQYADDTILFMEDDLDQDPKLETTTLCFEQASGLKINFHKSEIYCYREAKRRRTSIP
jgi:hypothetical protein